LLRILFFFLFFSFFHFLLTTLIAPPVNTSVEKKEKPKDEEFFLFSLLKDLSLVFHSIQLHSKVGNMAHKVDEEIRPFW